MTSRRREPGPLTVLVVTARFPSPIQPWLSNQLEQIVERGGRLEIVANGPEEGEYPSLVDRLRLLSHTHYYPVLPIWRTAEGLVRPLMPGTAAGRSSRAGLRRLLASGWRPGGWTEWMKSVVRAPVFDLPMDIVHAHTMNLAYEYRGIPRIRGVPMVLTFHGQTPAGVPDLSPAQREALFEEVTVALVNTRFAAGQLESLGFPGERIEVLPQGIRLSDHPYRPRPFPREGPVRLLTVARLQPDKGIRYAIDAVARLAERGHDVTYTIVGGGPEEADLRRRVRELGLGDVVRLTGRVDERRLRELYGASHVFILPSVSNSIDDHTETQGVVMQEAQASGLIVAASNVGGIPECVDPGRSAFLFPDRNAEALASTVESIIEGSGSWSVWQSRGREWVERTFDIDRIGGRLWSLYGDLLDRGRADRERAHGG